MSIPLIVGYHFSDSYTEMADSYTFALMKNQAMLNTRYPAHFSDEKLDLILDNINNPGKYTSYDLNPGEVLIPGVR
ncbi:MAG: hypothetical protein ACLVEJ_15425 [Parabacteroides sp.]